jgi:hypothetical protein
VLKNPANPFNPFRAEIFAGERTGTGILRNIGYLMRAKEIIMPRCVP